LKSDLAGAIPCEPFEPERWSRLCLFHRGQVCKSANLGKVSMRVSASGHAAAYAETGNFKFATQTGDFANSLAHECGVINAPFAGNDKVRPAQMRLEICTAGKEVKPRH
jgi:hypothetical protein